MEEKLWLIWKEPKSRKRYVIGLLTYIDKEYTFKYIDPEVNDANKNGFDSFPGFEDKENIYKSNVLFANIQTRLPNKGNPEYLSILRLCDLPPDATDMEILKRTKGRLLTDNYEFVPVFDKENIEFDVAGTRYSKDISKCKQFLNENISLLLEHESNNKQDSNAIKVIYRNNKNYHIGYVPRYYSKFLLDFLNKGYDYTCVIQKVNFDSNFYDEDVTATVKIFFNEND